MGEARLRWSDRLRRMLTYPKFAGETRLLILHTQYFFDRGWRHAAESLGWQVAEAPSVMVGGLTREQIRALFVTIGEFKPDFILASNFAGMDEEGLFARFFEDARLPYVSWFTDTPRMILFQRKVYPSHYLVAASWERAYIPHFERLGFQHVLFLPLATDPSIFHGGPSDRFERDVAFVGHSMINHAQDAWRRLERWPEVAAAVREAFECGRVTREDFSRGIEHVVHLDARPDCSEETLRDVELLLVYEATRRQRRELVQSLESLRIEVRGDPHWKQVTELADGPVGYFDDLAPYYRSTAVNLNSTSLQMKSAVNQRVFDCPAAGGFLITDAQGDLEELFDTGQEVVTYSDIGELKDRVTYYLRHPEERKGVIERAQRRILARHTHRHRLLALEKFLEERYT
ncbi:MAG: glycosyltransferase [Candidatus Hydrogenedentes bacterium]|nr:glycosyltransferase [Candidatus Hydrogenedentota bacterium]